eukprot:CAMPEP_0182867230 /NCGR_PEP_ID=MMETSP0034_2-20130328/8609_1 /TAXON_ID=156128 /ORGANISM="Nephroselmis pyriformis, Strain CCMP717" /LENGTH=139 /DNA_ID=CAMNT_0024999573 /DNA_START=335 /DNA_END=751 /DNA_ORIENTATION=+
MASAVYPKRRPSAEPDMFTKEALPTRSSTALIFSRAEEYAPRSLRSPLARSLRIDTCGGPLGRWGGRRRIKCMEGNGWIQGQKRHFGMPSHKAMDGFKVKSATSGCRPIRQWMDSRSKEPLRDAVPYVEAARSLDGSPR